jgi:hypothetical protein
MMRSKHICGCPCVNGNKVVVDLFFSCLLQDTTNTHNHITEKKVFVTLVVVVISLSANSLTHCSVFTYIPG